MSLWFSNSSSPPFGHPHFPFKSGTRAETPKAVLFPRYNDHLSFPAGKCKYVLADGGIIYCHKLGSGCGQEWPLAKHYSLAPLGGWAVWAELGWKGGKGQGQEFAAENWAGALHIVTMSGWNGGATTLAQDSWGRSMLREGQIGFPGDPETCHFGACQGSSVLLMLSCYREWVVAGSFNPKVPLFTWLNVTLSCAGFLSTQCYAKACLKEFTGSSTS